MAPAAQKRAWKNDAGERRPKKKVKRVKKQDDYYSSSEDEAAGPTARASDAPKNMPKRVAKVEEVEITGGNSLPLGERIPGRNTTSRREKKSAPRPKPILKKAAPEQISKATQPEKDSDGEEEEEEEEEEDDDDDDEGVQVGDLEVNTALNMQVDESSADDLDDENDEPDLDAASSADDSEDSDDDNAQSEDEGSIATSQASSATRARKKRNDPTAFATSISKILDTKLSTAKRSDPVLSRARSAVEANKTILDEKLESKARAQIRAEKRAAAEKGRVKDVLGLQTSDMDTGAILEEEKRLKKIAQRGVVYMFNAVRKAQISAEQERKRVAGEGVVGMQKREDRVNEMSKQGFLELISSGGKQPVEA